MTRPDHTRGMEAQATSRARIRSSASSLTRSHSASLLTVAGTQQIRPPFAIWSNELKIGHAIPETVPVAGPPGEGVEFAHVRFRANYTAAETGPSCEPRLLRPGPLPVICVPPRQRRRTPYLAETDLSEHSRLRWNFETLGSDAGGFRRNACFTLGTNISRFALRRYQRA